MDESQAAPCVACGGQVAPKSPLKSGPQPRLCSEICRKEHRSAYLKQWWQTHRDSELPKMAVRVKAFNKKNPDYFKQHYAKNRNARKLQSREWYRNNSERALAAQKAYSAANPEQRRLHGRKSAANRRAVKRQAFIEPVDPRVVFARAKGICGICMKPVDTHAKWDIDHVMPLSKGGAHAYSNVQLAHARCNRSKGAKVIGQAVA